MPVTPEEMRLIKEKFADVVIRFQQGSLDLPEALVAIRDFSIPSEEGGETLPPPEAKPDDNSNGDASSEDPGTGGEAESGDAGTGGAEGDQQTPSEEALASAQAELDAALEIALGRQ